MSQARQEKRRALKPKMQEFRRVVQKGGKVVMVAKRSFFERHQQIAQDPLFAEYDRTYQWLLHRPYPFGLDPTDPIEGGKP